MTTTRRANGLAFFPTPLGRTRPMKVGARGARLACGGLLAIVLLARLWAANASDDDRLQWALVRHHAAQLRRVRLVRTVGILEATRVQPIVPYGFRTRARWTDAPAVDVREKRDALPVHIIEMLLPRGCPGSGGRCGTSLFIDASAQRMVRRQRYQAAVDAVVANAAAVEAWMHDAWTVDAMRRAERARPEARRHVARRIAARACVALHLGRAPTDAEVGAACALMRAITRALHAPWRLPRVRRAQEALRAAARTSEPGGLLAAWRARGFDEADAFAEWMHNLFGMGLQWAYVLVRSWEACDAARARVHASDDAARQFLRAHPPATAAASRAVADDALVLHDLAAMCARGEDAVFGHGARRCPGAALSLAWTRASAASPRPATSRCPRGWLGLHRV